MPVVVGAATAWGRAALAVIRLSGPGLDGLLPRFCRPLSDRPLSWGTPRRAEFFDERGMIDDGLIWLARGPRTYTGEDTAEITCHGNPRIVQRVLDAAITAGARAAEPGEFTRLALVNGKLDLVGAEGVFQLSDARSDRGLEIARQGMSGALQAEFGRIRSELIALAADLEARLDYPADELAYFDDRVVLERAQAAADQAASLAESYGAGKVLVEGARVALVGPVNAGKSSLFNALIGRRRALVHDSPGTTRDVLEVVTEIQELSVTLLDTAGERTTDDPVEAAGLALARELVGEADLLLVVLRARPGGPDATEQAILERTRGQRRCVVYNGIDRDGGAAAPAGSIPVSALKNQGLEELKQAIYRALLAGEPAAGGQVIASARQRDALLAVAAWTKEGIEALPFAGPAVAGEAFTRAIQELDALTGADTREEILDELFSRFCIGK